MNGAAMVAEQIGIQMFKLGLQASKKVSEGEDFKKVVDESLNKAESFFPEGSLPDVIVETVTESIREAANVPDSNPDN